MVKHKSIKTRINHLAIIPDGNRRETREKGLSKKVEHYQGIENAKKIVNFVFDETDINYLTMYGFSKYNFDRDEEEKVILFHRMVKVVEKLSEWIPDDVGFIPAGDFSNFEQYKISNSKEREPSNLKHLFESTKRPSKFGRYLTILIGYDGVAEIEVGAEKLLEAYKSGEKVSGKDIQKYTYTSFLPPVDLMIRTGNERRISGFIPYLLSYAEMHFDEKMWPSFKVEDLRKVIEEYSKRKRRFGR